MIIIHAVNRQQASSPNRLDSALDENGQSRQLARFAVETAREPDIGPFVGRLSSPGCKDPAAKPTLEDFVDHLDHAVKVAGIDHVGIGSDFDGGGGVPGFNNVAEAPNVTIELVRRGYTEAQIRKIWGENLLRVWRDVERVAAGLAAMK